MQRSEFFRTDVTKKHYVKKTSARERKNKLLEIRKKAGF
nr:MAG TPA: hypothetical protein [Caudoviricetes sp.]